MHPDRQGAPIERTELQFLTTVNDNTKSRLLDDNASGYGELPERFASSSRYCKALLTHVAFAAVYTSILTAVFFRSRPDNCHASFVYYPAREAVEWQSKQSNNYIGAKTPFMGSLTPEGDEAWAELLKNSNLRVSTETLRRMNRSSVQLQDGSGDYMGGLNVHHHLHCIKTARVNIWRGDYNTTDTRSMWSHLDHCLEDLRLAIMCHPDLTILTYDWMPNYKRPWPNFAIDRECVNWEKLEAWAEERAFSLFDRKSIVHPDLGLSFPLIDGVPDEGTVHADPADIETIKLGTNPKGNWGPKPNEI